MTEETAKQLIEALNNLSEQLSTPKKLYREDVQRIYELGRDTVNDIFKDPRLNVQKIGRKDFVTIQALNEYFTNYRHERNSL